MIARPPRSTLFPRTTLFRSEDRNLARPDRLRVSPVGPAQVPDAEGGRGADVDRRTVGAREARRPGRPRHPGPDRKSTRLNSSHGYISYAVFCLKKKKTPDRYPCGISGRTLQLERYARPRSAVRHRPLHLNHPRPETLCAYTLPRAQTPLANATT